MRPNCDQILNMEIVKKRLKLIKSVANDTQDSFDVKYGADEIIEEENNLLNTIKVPKNLT